MQKLHITILLLIMKKITTLEMEISLMEHFGVARNLIITNTYETTFETDVLVLSKAGYATGVEIKVSKADLRNDLKKHHIKSLGKVIRGKSGKERYFKDFKKFYYAVPKHLESEALEQIPSFCGLLVAERVGRYLYPKIFEIRKPSTLFKKKWTEKEQLRVAHLGTMRIQGLKEKTLSLQNEIDRLKKSQLELDFPQ